jgi:NAD(P)-dependent dehydrogenase (short-subunit alcohol dehydrogenase family)
LILAADGASLSLADRNEAGLSRVKKEVETLGAKVITAALDVTCAADVEAWIKTTYQHFGKLDGAANIAGVEPEPPTPVGELTDRGMHVLSSCSFYY